MGSNAPSLIKYHGRIFYRANYYKGRLGNKAKYNLLLHHVVRRQEEFVVLREYGVFQVRAVNGFITIVSKVACRNAGFPYFFVHRRAKASA